MKRFPSSITSVHNPRVKAAVRLRQQRHRQVSGRFIAEGYREVSRAIAAGLDLIELYFCAETVGGCQQTRRLIHGVAPSLVIDVSPAVMAKLAYRENPEGILAVFGQPSYQLQDIEAEPSNNGLAWPANRWVGHELWLVTIGTQKPGNLGAMARSAEAAGCRGLLVADGVVDAFNPNAIRASTGAVFVLPVVAADAGLIVEFLQKRAVRLMFASPRSTTALSSTDLSGPVAIVVGPEDTGLDGATLPSDASASPLERVSIPMFSESVDSLNVSAAAAVLLYEAVRQRIEVRAQG